MGSRTWEHSEDYFPFVFPWWCFLGTGHSASPGVFHAMDDLYYVWPPVVIVRQKNYDNKEAMMKHIKRLSPCEPFPTLEAAQAACRLLYG